MGPREGRDVDSEIGYAELFDEAPDYLPDGHFDDVDGEVAGEDAAGEPPVDASPPPPLHQRMPRDRADDGAGGGELPTARTNQRPSGSTARSPEEVRSLLSNYRGGLERDHGDR